MEKNNTDVCWMLQNPEKSQFCSGPPHGKRMEKNIANLRYPAKNDKFFAGERRYDIPINTKD